MFRRAVRSDVNFLLESITYKQKYSFFFPFGYLGLQWPTALRLLMIEALFVRFRWVVDLLAHISFLHWPCALHTITILFESA